MRIRTVVAVGAMAAAAGVLIVKTPTEHRYERGTVVTIEHPVPTTCRMLLRPSANPAHSHWTPVYSDGRFCDAFREGGPYTLSINALKPE